MPTTLPTPATSRVPPSSLRNAKTRKTLHGYHTFAEISKQNFRPIPVVLPLKELMAAFTAKVAPIYAKITANLYQSGTLATLRDALQPRLLSGELSVAHQGHHD